MSKISKEAKEYKNGWRNQQKFQKNLIQHQLYQRITKVQIMYKGIVDKFFIVFTAQWFQTNN